MCFTAVLLSCKQKDTVALNNQLLEAAKNGNFDQVKEAIKSGANINIQNEEKLTPLMMMVIYGRTEGVKWFVQEKADLQIVDKQGLTALHYATLEGNKDIVRVLRDAQGGKPYPDIFIGSSIGATREVKEALAAGVDVNAKNSLGMAAVHLAVHNKHLNVVETLIGAGANLNEADNEGMTPLMEAIRAPSPEALKLLVKSKVDLEKKDSKGSTILAWAVDMKIDLKYVVMLVNAGADVNTQNHEGETPLMIATQTRELETMNFLIRSGAKLDIQDKDGDTALTRAVTDSSDPAVVTTLIKSGANLRMKNAEGKTAIIIAEENAIYKYVDILKDAARQKAQ